MKIKLLIILDYIKMVRSYVLFEELFHILYETHASIVQGERDRTTMALQNHYCSRYLNIFEFV